MLLLLLRRMLLLLPLPMLLLPLPFTNLTKQRNVLRQRVIWKYHTRTWRRQGNTLGEKTSEALGTRQRLCGGRPT